MSVTLYDESVVNLFRKWTGDGKITIAPPDEVFSYRAHLNEDQVKLPLISLNRVGATIVDPNKQPKSYDGITCMASDGKVFKLRAIPIKINYQIDVITRFRKECDNLIRELIFKIVNNPTSNILIRYNGSEYSHDFSMLLGEEIEDNSDIIEHNEKGEYFRETLNMYVDDAYLFSYKEFETKTLDVSVEADLAVEIDTNISIDASVELDKDKNKKE